MNRLFVLKSIMLHSSSCRRTIRTAPAARSWCWPGGAITTTCRASGSRAAVIAAPGYTIERAVLPAPTDLPDGYFRVELRLFPVGRPSITALCGIGLMPASAPTRRVQSFQQPSRPARRLGLVGGWSPSAGTRTNVCPRSGVQPGLLALSYTSRARWARPVVRRVCPGSQTFRAVADTRTTSCGAARRRPTHLRGKGQGDHRRGCRSHRRSGCRVDTGCNGSSVLAARRHLGRRHAVASRVRRDADWRRSGPRHGSADGQLEAQRSTCERTTERCTCRRGVERRRV